MGFRGPADHSPSPPSPREAAWRAAEFSPGAGLCGRAGLDLVTQPSSADF